MGRVLFFVGDAVVKETDLYVQLARYMNAKYPSVPYHFDLSGVNNPSPASRSLYAQLNGRGWPDLHIASAVCCPGPDGNEFWLHGLFLELKKDGEKVFLKDGKTLVTKEHVHEQDAALKKLRGTCYAAEFSIGYERSVEIIDQYLSGRWFTRKGL